jgi:hypothetical protein
MKNTLLLSTFLLAGFLATAQPEKEMKHIESLCGCYTVSFKYAETFSPDAKYKFHDREEMIATELALPIEKTDKKIVIQHLLVVQDTVVIKHWREEWVYEPDFMYQFMGNRVWTRKPLTEDERKGKWLQTVWEVSDEPRYQGLSAWIQNDGKTYWESSADAPLPRREYTVRNDYNIMHRRNRIILTQDGYMHEQDNDKVLRTGTTDKLLVQEKGYNSYFRMDDAECKRAGDWWAKNQQFWIAVKDKWESLMAGHQTVSLKPTVQDKMLHEVLFALWREWKTDKTFTNQRISDAIDQFVIKGQPAGARS